MPTFYSEAELDIEIDEFLNSLDGREINELIDALVEDGHLSPNYKTGVVDKNKNFLDLEWDTICEKIRNSRLQLSNEDELTIRMISEKL
jgi:hypothetical protein